MWKRVVVAVGIGLILWGYYQLFGIEPDASLINRRVTAITDRDEISGEVVGIRERTILVSSNRGIVEVRTGSILRIEGLLVNEYETKRAMNAVFIIMIGGVIVWAGLFLI
ncbi:MAG: hypothetical protein A2X55_09900 [Nitrospirae bacterium GWB2_47_37]|nr:MAG: hypothetical protein A2Z82_08935 [Nitrospirae bacterium GWA2_46_11]OGW23998.1 MAG: hypothetical protein A2X55_09900 [Nitrospirae bacterium GWB2_47_37]HAK88851.1 hypothetical protein [Nitrospiraceae bacterium]